VRYSQVIGDSYHLIQLDQNSKDFLDAYYTGAAHHFWRLNQSHRNSQAQLFHSYLFKEHLKNLMRVIYDNGDFSCAIDPTGLDLHLRSKWNPIRASLGLPDPEMFDSMKPDPKFLILENHPNDMHLPNYESISSNSSFLSFRNKRFKN